MKVCSNKLLSILALALLALSSSSIAMESTTALSFQDISIVEHAIYFKIHQADYCEMHQFGSYATSKPQECIQCRGCSLVSGNFSLVITYHDKSWNLLGKIEMSEVKSGTALYEYAKSRLDPNAKPEAHRAVVAQCIKRGRIICFYDKQGEYIDCARYHGAATLEAVELKEFEKRLDLSALISIEDKTQEASPSSLLGTIANWIVKSAFGD